MFRHSPDKNSPTVCIIEKVRARTRDETKASAKVHVCHLPITLSNQRKNTKQVWRKELKVKVQGRAQSSQAAAAHIYFVWLLIHYLRSSCLWCFISLPPRACLLPATLFPLLCPLRRRLVLAIPGRFECRGALQPEDLEGETSCGMQGIVPSSGEQGTIGAE